VQPAHAPPPGAPLRPPPALAAHVSRFGPVLLAVALAVLLRWPVSVYMDAIPRDPNTALHMVMAADLARTGDVLHLGGLDFPDVVPVRLVAWPLVLLASGLGLVLPAIVAFNLATTIWVALQGIAVDALGRAWGWSAWGRAAAVVAAQAAPFALLSLGNGQYENVAVLPFCLIAWAAGRHWGWTALGLVLAASCSPYQAVVAGVLAVMGATRHGLGALRGVAMAAVLAAAPVVLYYGNQAASDDTHDDPVASLALARTRPAPPIGVIGARVDGLFLPRSHQTTQMHRARTPAERIEAAKHAPTWSAPGGLWLIEEATVAGWLGAVGLLAGLIGLWRKREDRRVQGVALSGLVCLVLALGDRLVVSEGVDTGLPLPWALVYRFGGPAAAMVATSRFLSGAAFALAVGIGSSVRRPPLAALLAGGITAEVLLLAPGAWPIQASAPEATALRAALPDGPIAVWPGTPVVSGMRHELLYLALDRPVATFSGPPADGGNIAGFRPTLPKENRAGETTAEWLARVQAAGVGAVVELTDIPQGLGLPLDLEVVATPPSFKVYAMPDGPGTVAP
jgi:hypothetical protein